jgi:hypothetical protein
MALTAHAAWFAQVDELLAAAGTSREELEFPFSAWADRNVSAEWIVPKAIVAMTSEEAA